MLQIPTREILSLWLGRVGPLKEATSAKLYQSYFARDSAFDAKCKTYEPHINTLIAHYKEQDLPSLDPYDSIITDESAVAAFPKSKDETLSHILLLDQFSRNIWRGREAVKVYNEADPIAHQLSIYALQKQWDVESDWLELLFMSMPLTHAESFSSHIRLLRTYLAKIEQVDKAVQAGEKTTQERGVALLALKSQYEHLDLINQFGRYPHRNKVLNRGATDAEVKYMASGGTTFGADA
ncbi:hypothetical protein BCR37DRAFT_384939 [Protomyces lactucae-debilis]|uniref:DUF924-domain-containing protein n=1 Tax=Protomyces lactucae-debilis TaxID=2754530 RepID=A0A1Y2FUE8_PROLT|nr:uncharacterized protein BCR37DRAFT_384939 [Protomyces lactucae-debilis]ORY87622.1 hypothetical protein BCR37DRAFT_384939 [Protomyces lactucae-debilis]